MLLVGNKWNLLKNCKFRKTKKIKEKRFLTMKNNNIVIKNRKDAYMVIKSIGKLCEKLINLEKEIFINELNKIEGRQYRSELGLLHIRAGKPKTIKTYSEAERLEIEKIDAQIAKLEARKEKLGTTITLDSQPQILVMDLENTAEKEAVKQLKPVIYALDNKTLINMIENMSEE